jgi:hypothetical protein
MNLVLGMRGKRVRASVHPTSAIEQILGENGLSRYVSTRRPSMAGRGIWAPLTAQVPRPPAMAAAHRECRIRLLASVSQLEHQTPEMDDQKQPRPGVLLLDEPSCGEMLALP